MVKKLSKSSINLYLQCPYKWKKSHIDNVEVIPSPAMLRGTKIHNKIENYYKNPTPDNDLKNLIEFDKRRANDMRKQGIEPDKFIKPLFQELKLSSDKLNLKGILDAVFINPEDGKLIVIDWKTGKYNKDNLNDYRLELAIYKLLLEDSEFVDKEVGYWGIYFIDADKLFFEPVSQKCENEVLNTIMEVRRGIEMESFHPKRNMWCKYCQFKGVCGK